jgi:hypothetical protein
MIEEFLKKLIEDKNYNFSNMKINFIKENDEFYVVYFEEKISTIGRALNFKIEKKTGEHDEIYLPDLENFQFLDDFENCNFVDIPEKYRNKYF